MKVFCLCGEDNFDPEGTCPNCGADLERIKEVMDTMTPEGTIEELKRLLSGEDEDTHMMADTYVLFLRVKELIENFWYT